MKNLLKLLILLVFVSCNLSKEKRTENKDIINSISIHSEEYNDLNRLRLDYGDNLLLRCFYLINKNNIKLELYDWNSVKIVEDWINLEEKAREILREKPSIINDIFEKINSLDVKEELLSQIKTWCDTYLLIQIHNNYKSVIYFEEVIHKIPTTKGLVTSFLNDESQGWDSLSSSQVYELYYMVPSLIYKFKDEEKVKFYIAFMRELEEQIKKPR